VIRFAVKNMLAKAGTALRSEAHDEISFLCSSNRARSYSDSSTSMPRSSIDHQHGVEGERRVERDDIALLR